MQKSKYPSVQKPKYPSVWALKLSQTTKPKRKAKILEAMFRALQGVQK